MWVARFSHLLRLDDERTLLALNQYFLVRKNRLFKSFLILFCSPDNYRQISEKL
jgi:hypothetical protein